MSGTHAERLARIREVVDKYERELRHETSQFAIEVLNRQDYDLLRARRELRRMLDRHHAWQPSNHPGDPGPGGRLTPLTMRRPRWTRWGWTWMSNPPCWTPAR